MLPFEEHATWLLVLHTVLAGALIAAATHLVVWMRGYPRRRWGRVDGARALATWTAIFYVGTFLVGNLLYPAYKVRVRLEHFETPASIARSLEAGREAEARARARIARSREARTGEVLEVRPAVPPTADDVERAAHRGRQLSRWFDVKEHLVAIGMMLAVAVAFLMRRWRPDDAGPQIATAVLALATTAALFAWAAGVIGVITAAARSVAAL